MARHGWHAANTNRDSAMGLLNRAFGRDDDAQCARGDALRAQGQPLLAMREYDRLVMLNPSSWTAHNRRGICHADLGQPQRAIADFGRAIQLAPQQAVIYFNRAQSYIHLGQLEAALGDCTQALRLDPRDGDFWRSYGTIHLQLGKLEEADSAYSRALTCSPQDARALGQRGLVRFGLGRRSEAQADAQATIRLDPDLAVSYAVCGYLCFDQEKFEDAVRLLSAAIEREPDDAEYYMGRARSLCELEEHARALQAPEEQAVWDWFTDEESPTYKRQRLPAGFTGGPVVYACSLHFHRDFLRQQYIEEWFVECVAEPGESGRIELLPYWVTQGPYQPRAR